MTTSAQSDLPPDRPAETGEIGTAAPLTGDRVRGMFAAAAAWLERNAQAINAINVFPVPDGDTGSNMAATLKGAVAALSAGQLPADEVTAAIARSALLSARGNSGVILSQLLRGFAEATAGAERLDGRALARALAGGSKAAYGAVEHPVEGTMLTVATAAATAAGDIGTTDPSGVLEAALAGARAALARTPEQLPVLKQAGVVDSGGYGLMVILEGAVKFLRGEPLPDAAHAVDGPRQSWLEETASLHRGGGSAYGYCTEYVLSGADLDTAELRERLTMLGDSVIVAGDAGAAHIHLHTEEPGAAIGFGTALGLLSSIKIDNMQAQYAGFAAAVQRHAAAAASRDGERQSEQTRQIAVVAVVSGEGLAEIARSLRVSRVVTGGQTMNPSVEELLRGIEDAPSDRVIVLPNNKNVILTAEQAARLSGKRVAVMRTISVPQGFGAMFTFDPEADLDENVRAMQQSAARVRTIEVTRAARAAQIGDLQIEEGQPIGLIDDELAVTGETTLAALLAAVGRLRPAAAAAVTLYYGQDVAPNEAMAAEEQLLERFPGLDIQTLAGGQPFYDYILAVE